MLDQAQQLQKRTKEFAIAVIRFIRTLPSSDESRILGKQLMRSATSVAANYRAVCRARSRAEFIAKLGIVVEEADETVFWLELMTEAGAITSNDLPRLLTEANEILRIFSASLSTVKSRKIK
jgi:four helix bundle protein